LPYSLARNGNLSLQPLLLHNYFYSFYYFLFSIIKYYTTTKRNSFYCTLL